MSRAAEALDGAAFLIGFGLVVSGCAAFDYRIALVVGGLGLVGIVLGRRMR